MIAATNRNHVMGLIGELLGNLRSSGAKSARRTIADVEAALSRLANERTAAREAVSIAMRQRDELLLVDETDQKIADLDAIGDRHRLTLERCEKAEPLLLAELESLRGDAKRERWRGLVERSDAALEAYLIAFRSAVEAGETLAKLRGEAQGGGFMVEMASVLPAEARVLGRDSMTLLEAEVERRRDAAMPRPAPQPRPAAPPPAPKPAAATASAKPAKAAPLKPEPAPALAKIEPPKPDENGELRVKFILDGFEFPGREGPNRPRVGEKLSLQANYALAAVRASVAVFEER